MGQAAEPRPTLLSAVCVGTRLSPSNLMSHVPPSPPFGEARVPSQEVGGRAGTLAARPGDHFCPLI